MPRTTIDNAAFDTRLAGYTFAPYTAITRQENVVAVQPNSHLQVLCQSALGVDFYVSYDQLGDATIANDIVKQAHGLQGALIDLATLIQGLSNLMTPANAAAADETLFLHITRLLAHIPQLVGHIPHRAFDETYQHDVVPVVSISAADATANTATITDSSTGITKGTASFILWDFGDGSWSINETETSHVYASAGAKTITKIVVGPQGVFTDTANVTVTT